MSNSVAHTTEKRHVVVSPFKDQRPKDHLPSSSVVGSSSLSQVSPDPPQSLSFPKYRRRRPGHQRLPSLLGLTHRPSTPLRGSKDYSSVGDGVERRGSVTVRRWVVGPVGRTGKDPVQWSESSFWDLSPSGGLSSSHWVPTSFSSRRTLPTLRLEGDSTRV